MKVYEIEDFADEFEILDMLNVVCNQLIVSQVRGDRYAEALRGESLIDRMGFCLICGSHLATEEGKHAPDCAKAAAEKEGE